ncbi:diacylglycerol kinase [Streptobacillus felis]|uniref:Diacylglycerol kinase n=1 Tax=Streptobacillus felis TaxID=1384509 RepID=A0A7Z0TAB9_9FUSO|nr:diacylglycerol kinase [Streptobacillus felis]NYV27860.1 diacylglycerol kinase [Streptobacillus felis]
MKNNKVSQIDSFNNAINGILHAISTELHMKIHIFFAIFVLILSLIIDISKFEIIILIIMITLVIFSELINTAVEKIVDLVSPEYNEIAKFAKDVAAGAVLVNAIGAIGVGYLIFYDRLISLYFSGDNFFKLVGRIGNVTMIILALVSLSVIILKSYFKKGTLLEGGMPSGHSAIAFAMLAIVMFLTSNPRIITLVLLMALLVAQSRVKSKIHTLKEVVVGAILGFGISFLVLEILYKFGTLIN